MNTNEKVQLFFDSITCCYPLYRWEYTADMKPLVSGGPPEMIGFDLLQFLGLHKAIQKEVEKKTHVPLVLDTSFGLLWFAGFEFEEDEVQKIHIFGPVFTGNLSRTVLIHRLNHYGFSRQAMEIALKLLGKVAIMPYMILTQYAQMLHFLLTGEKITREQVLYLTTTEIITEDESPDDEAQVSDLRGGIYFREREFLNLVREGNMNYREALSRMANASPGVRQEVKDPLRHAKNNSLVLLTLVSRAALEGGLDAGTSYALMDMYSERIERAASFSSVVQLNSDLVDDYVSRVNQVRTNHSISAEIQECLQYISLNIAKPLTIEELADRAGYTPYYFSLKFKKETHQGVSDYIMQKKMEQAAMYLKNSSMSIEQIQEALSLVSRSHFYESFKKWSGMSPGTYRKKGGKSI